MKLASAAKDLGIDLGKKYGSLMVVDQQKMAIEARRFW
jgi:hypothetical protein